ncbi:MAG TPA: LOG family protein [Ktedonobacterales bacterium]|nr:LOG family protein [Ktedonobacterales bacterium]
MTIHPDASAITPRRIAVFAGTTRGGLPLHEQAANVVGARLAAAQCELIFDGSPGGLIATVAEAVRAEAGQVIGVVPAAWDAAWRYPGCTQYYEAASLWQRMALIGDLADGFIILPGGLETTAAMFDVLHLAHLAQHHKPIGLLNTEAFFAPHLALLEHLQQQGFLRMGTRAPALLCERDPTLLVTLLLAAVQAAAGER